MAEMAPILGWLAAAVLFAAGAAWLKMGRRPLLRKLNGNDGIERGQQVENASRLLFIAGGTSAVAAIVAIFGLMFA